jgi:hypothetical protein
MDNAQPVKPYTGGRIDGWARGMDNRRANFDLPADVLRGAINCDVLSSGKVRRRRGISQKIADTGAHSAFANEMYFIWATANALKLCTENFAARTLLTDVRLGTGPLSCFDVNGDIFFSNEQINGKVNVLGTYEPWGIVPPVSAPTCTTLDVVPATDAFAAAITPTLTGRNTKSLNRHYQVTCTFVLASGEESGAPLGTKVIGGDTGYISITNIPQSTDSRVVSTRIYVTDIDSDVFYAHVDVPAGITSTRIAGPYAKGKELKTQFIINPPAGQLVDYTRGRIYIAVGNLVYFTEPIQYGRVNSRFGFYIFPERVTLLKGTNNGLYVSSDITYYIEGDPRPMKEGGSIPAKLVPVLPYKAIEGAACNLADSQDVMWLSERGVIFGKDGGDAKNLTEDRIAMENSTRGCMSVVELNGVKSAVAIMTTAKDSAFIHSDFVEAEQDRIADLLL